MKFFVLPFVCAALAFAIIPNQNLSQGKMAYVNGADSSAYLTDGSLTNWKYAETNDVAIHIGEGPSRLFVSWELYSYGGIDWADFASSCPHTKTLLTDFAILTSANSTTGFDGDWDTAYVVTNNQVMARGAAIDFEGKSWIRLLSSESPGQFLEVEAFDISNGQNDTWFFMGTSISAMGIKQQDTDSTATTAKLIHEKFPEYTPAMLRGGVSCINTTDIVNHLPEYLEAVGNVNFWAIEMGTNDGWGGGTANLSTYVQNLQTIIDSAKAHGISIVLARTLATDSSKAGWQIAPEFLAAEDSLILVNDLYNGPDFYGFFKEHPEYLNPDGVHPNGETGGGAQMHRLWAEAIAPIYADASSAIHQNRTLKKSQSTSLVKVIVQNGAVEIRTPRGSSVQSFDLRGRTVR
ncbi:MAG: SGNH/GDSL hydrolase family protein [Fibrobacter sp.]|nr:SGNH/GDSL hydrolase family protein [Fibrobacter sp.]